MEIKPQIFKFKVMCDSAKTSVWLAIHQFMSLGADLASQQFKGIPTAFARPSVEIQIFLGLFVFAIAAAVGRCAPTI